MTQDRRVALITGGATGIGRATALALADAGFDAVINYSRNEAAARETSRLAQGKGAKTLLFRCDVSDDPTVRKMLLAVEHEFGRLDALVNNAGTTTEIKPQDFDALTAEEWDRVFAVNVREFFRLRALLYLCSRRLEEASSIRQASSGCALVRSLCPMPPAKPQS